MRGGPGFGRGFQEATMTRNNAPQAPTNSYATDGKCHNAEPGTYGHECGKPAAWIGTNHGLGDRTQGLLVPRKTLRRLGR